MKKIYFLFGWEVKVDLSQKILGNMMFSICWVKMVFFFPTKMKLSFCQISKDALFSKNTTKVDISVVLLKKMIFILEKMIMTF